MSMYSQITQADIYHRSGDTVIDFRETGSTATLTATANTSALLLAQGFVRLDHEDDGDEYDIPATPGDDACRTVHITGALHAPQIAAMIIAPAQAVPTMAEAQEIIEKFRAEKFHQTA